MKSTNRKNVMKSLLGKIMLSGMLLMSISGRVAAQSDPAYVFYSLGGMYMAHVWDADNSVWTLQATATFSPECVWYSSNANNYYFFDDHNGNAKRYLSANGSQGATVTTTTTPSGLSNDQSNEYFFNWDWGLARGLKPGTSQAECPANDWDGSVCWEVYWIIYNNGWTTSSRSYDIVNNAAVFRRVKIVEHPENITSSTGGLGNLSDFSIAYENGNGNHPLSISTSLYSYSKTPAYTTYSIGDIACNDANWTARKCDTTWMVHNYYNNSDNGNTIPQSVESNDNSVSSYSWTLSGDGTSYLSFESGSNMLTSTSSAPTVYYRNENKNGDKNATLTLTVTYSDGSTQTRTATITVLTECGHPAQAAAAKVTYEGVVISWVRTSYDYNIEYKKAADASWTTINNVGNKTSYTLTGLDNNTPYNYRVSAVCDPADPSTAVSYNFTTKEAPGVLIYGAVFGGGRMANVAGNTEVIIINCDSISAVYGGNDIAGAVQGGIGSTITLGVNAGDTYSSAYNSNAASTKVNVGSVYGGGNGYYAYNGSSFVAADNDHTSQTVAVSGTVNAMTQQHSVGAAAWTNTGANSVTLNIPAIVKTAITVTNDNVKIDSLFGGAKNAFVSSTAGNSTNITLDGGTIFAVFGGNNFGGTLGAGSTQKITVNNTKQDLTAVNETNSYSSGFGRDFGVRYLFGGGNKVAGRNIDIDILGGQCDTVFGGGNAADVGSVDVTVNCELGSANAEKTLFNKVITNSAVYKYEDGTLSINSNYIWNGKGLYNVRSLFGGNNAADMNHVPTITLNSGHIGTVYGGGNAGRMLDQATDDGNGASLVINGNNVKYGTHVVSPANSNILVDYLYGGCQKSDVLYSTWVEIKGGHVGTIYGGCNISGDVGSTRTNLSAEPVNNDYTEYQKVQGGTYVVVSGGTIYKNVFAGSNGFYHCNEASGLYRYISGINYDDAEGNYIGIPIPTHNETTVLINTGADIRGNVYAGGNLANVGFRTNYSGNSNYPKLVGFATVKMTGGSVAGDVYGGGNMAPIYGINEVYVSGGSIGGALYGGNDRVGLVGGETNRTRTASLASDGETSIASAGTYVEVGGNPHVNTVYGGGNGDYDYTVNSDIPYCGDNPEKPIQSSPFVDIHITDEGRIETVYGGGDGVTVNGNITVFLNIDGTSTQDNVGTIFGGNNKGDLSLLPDIILLNGWVNTVYGGCNQGAMTGSHTVTSAGGTEYSTVGSLVRLRENYDGNGDGNSETVTAKVTGNVYGGCRLNGVTNNSLVLVEGGTHTADLYGGSDISGTIGGVSQVMIEGGTVNDVYGGGNGDYTYDHTNHTIHKGQTLVATGDFGTPSCANTNVIITGGTAANLFGGGKAAGAVNTTITMDGGTVTTGIYGGSESAGNISGDVLVNINAGTVGADGDPADGIFGGGYGASTTTAGNVTVNIGNADSTAANDARPILYSDVYGGSALGTVNDATSDLTTVNIINGTVNGNIYGGGLGAATLDGNGFIDLITQAAVVNGSVQVNIGLSTQTSTLANGYYNYVTINGKVFGCNNLAGSPKGSVNVDVYHTAHTTSPDNRYPTGEITIDNIPNQAAYAIAEVYGGGNLAAYAPTADPGVYLAPAVHIHNCDNTIEFVYGGGNAALVPATNVTIDGGRFDYIFAGGNGAGTGNPGANITDDVTLTINGGIASYVFGGSNTKGTIGGDKNITIDKVGSCIDPTILNFFAGGNRAEGTGGTINITNCGFRVVNFYGGANMAPTTGDVTTNIYGGTYHNIFGGSNAADINGNVTVNFYGGTVTNIFGGNNAKGQISGNIVVNVIKNDQYCSAFSVDNVYGGGKDARYGCANNNDSTHNGYPQVNILHTGNSQINYDVFGGGLGEGAQIWGRPTVTVGGTAKITIGENQVDRVVTVGRNVYGGGSAAQVNGNTDVSIIGNSTINGNVYGGGNEAVVTGNTDVKIGD